MKRLCGARHPPSRKYWSTAGAVPDVDHVRRLDVGGHEPVGARPGEHRAVERREDRDVGRPAGAHRADRLSVLRVEHGEEPGDPALDPLLVHDVGLVDARPAGGPHRRRCRSSRRGPDGPSPPGRSPRAPVRGQVGGGGGRVVTVVATAVVDGAVVEVVLASPLLPPTTTSPRTAMTASPATVAPMTTLRPARLPLVCLPVPTRSRCSSPARGRDLSAPAREDSARSVTHRGCPRPIGGSGQPAVNALWTGW